MKKIGLVTVYGEYNYGNKLQNYALMSIYKKLGCNPITLQTYQSALRESPNQKLKRSIKKIISFIPGNNKYRFSFLRKSNFISFSKKYLNITPKMWTTKFDKHFFDTFDVLSVGSDQVWNDHDYDINDVKYFSLNYDGHYKKIAFAASIGKPSFREAYLKSFVNGISSFDLITCREKTGVDYLSAIIKKDVFLCCDPTLFLDKDEWKQIAKRPSWLTYSKYNLYYFLGQYTAYPKKENDIEIVDLSDQKSLAFTAGPEEFVYLIQNAHTVYTDSFHACVFSMIFSKKFVVYKRDDKDINNQMSSRITSLFEIFNANKGYNELIIPSDYSDFEKNRIDMVKTMLHRLEQIL